MTGEAAGGGEVVGEFVRARSSLTLETRVAFWL